MRTAFEKFRKAYGNPSAPKQIWEVQFDYDQKALKRLCSPVKKLPNISDLYSYYLHDLNYVSELQPDLFAYLLPFCLQGWHEDLMHGTAGGFVEQFHCALGRRPLLEMLLPLRQRSAVFAFLRDSLLESLEQTSGLRFQEESVFRYRMYRRFSYLASYGVIVPDVEGLWREWWEMRSRGYTVAALQYASCLMYPTDANPVFAPWTPTEGGGPPCLWEYDSIGFEEHWLPVNVEFLARTLSVDYLHEKIALAVQRLEGEPEHEQAVRIQSDFAEWQWLAEARIPELIKYLATPSPVGILEWTL